MTAFLLGALVVVQAAGYLGIVAGLFLLIDRLGGDR